MVSKAYSDSTDGKTGNYQVANVNVRNLPDEVHRAIRIQAALHGRSTEAEMRAILEAAVCPPDRVRLGSSLAALSRAAGLTNADFEAISGARDRRPAEPMRFE